MLFALEIKEIKKGDIIEDSVERLEKKYYKVGIDNLKNIHVTLTNMTKDIDLYLKTETYSDVKDNTPIEQRVPTIRKNDCYSSNGRGIDEECNYRVVGPAPGAYDANVYILVYGFEAGSYRLEVKEEEAEKIDSLSEEPLRGKVEKGESKQYKIYGKAGETVEASIFNLTGDADIRLKIGRKANLHTFDCKSINGGTKTDSCSVTLKHADTVYVHVYGYNSANYSITGSHTANNVDDKLIKKTTEFCLDNQGGTTNSSEEEIICAEMHGRQDGAYVLDKKNYRVLYIKNEQITQQKDVTRGNKSPRIVDNKDNESYTIAYYNGLTYTFYAFLGNEIKEVLKYTIPNQAKVTKVYIAQKNSDIWQIYLEYTDTKSEKSYRDVYYSSDFRNNYILHSHKEI
jgi:hypothetical protein